MGRAPFVIASVFLVFFLAGIAASELGMTTDTIDVPTQEERSNVLDFQEDAGTLDRIASVLTFGANSIGSFFQLLTFEIGGMPVLFTTVIFFVVFIVILVKLIQIVLGGGD